ncbi:hypothetical protein [Sphingobacterium spiritivorum]|uniref:hypothetical protein n=1 Tax=Sphingobacterium spiritivorum TaxID=258 RepID=UPI003DA33CA6
MKKLPKILNKAELARAMWPDKGSAPVLLNMKLSGINRNSLTSDDKQAMIFQLEKAIEDIKAL